MKNQYRKFLHINTVHCALFLQTFLRVLNQHTTFKVQSHQKHFTGKKKGHYSFVSSLEMSETQLTKSPSNKAAFCWSVGQRGKITPKTLHYLICLYIYIYFYLYIFPLKLLDFTVFCRAIVKIVVKVTN